MKKKRLILITLLIFLLVTLAYHAGQYYEKIKKQVSRKEYYNELRTTRLSNCEIKRIGDKFDGGYAVCANLLHDVRSVYSYGIEGRDAWGCDASKITNATVHQYDCFNSTRPICKGGKTLFHEECIGAKTEIIKEKKFNTLANQIAENGDSGKNILVKMDVESAEWDSLLNTPESVLEKIDQLVIELHHVNDAKYAKVIRYLKKYFYIVDIHFNNFSCTAGKDNPFPAWALEALFVNKRIGQVEKNFNGPQMTTQVNHPNNPSLHDCQEKM